MRLIKISLLFTAFFIHSLPALTQQNKIVATGSVMAGQDLPLHSATIKLISATDTTRLISSLTDREGKYRIENVQPGKYMLKITFAGYGPYHKTIDLNDAISDIGSIILKKDLATLKEVTVTATKPLIESRAGMTIYNVASDPMAIGKSMADIAGSLPGVSQNAGGSITVDGESQVAVMVNGRKSNINTADLLRQLQPANVERLELITGADPRFASMTGVAVLNVVLKKNKQKGTNGNASLMVNNYGSMNASLNLNKFTGKTNYYIFLSSDDRYNKNSSYYQRQYSNTGEIFFSGSLDNQLTHSLRTLTAGADFYVDSLNIITVEHGVTFHGDAMDAEATQTLNGTPGSPKTTTSFTSSPAEWENTTSVNHRKNFKTQQKYLETEISTTFFTLTNEKLYTQSSFLETLSLSSSALRARSELAMPVNKKHLLSIGVDYSLINTKSQSITRTIGTAAGNMTDYQSHKTALFGTLNYKAGSKWRFRPGLRLERAYTHAGSNQFQPVLFDQTTAYPTLNILWEASKKKSLSLDFIRRINYPDLYEFYTRPNQPDTFNIHLSNPKLIPAIRNNLTLEFRYKAKRINWTLRTYGRITENMMQAVAVYEPGNKIITSTENIGTMYAYGGSLTALIEAAHNWKMRIIANFNFSNADLKRNIYAAYSDLYDISGSFTSRHIFNKKADAEINFRLMHLSRGLNEKTTQPVYNLSFQYNYKINNQWTVALLANDILFTMKNYFNHYPSPLVIQSQQSQSRSRFIQVTIRYRLGSEGKSRDRKLDQDKIQFSTG